LEPIRSWPNQERGGHYQQQANKLRQIAEIEPDEQMRNRLLAIADQYQALADKLSPKRN
jgi:hypothetical protein